MGGIVVSAELVVFGTDLHVDQGEFLIKLELGDEGLNGMSSLLIFSQVT